MAKKAWPRIKDPDELRDYGIGWTADLNGATIVNSTWEVVDGTVTIDSDSFTTVNTTVRIAGGALDEKALLTNTVTLSNGEIAQQSGILTIKER